MFVQGYRPGGLAARGFGARRTSRGCDPGSCSCRSARTRTSGPWSERRGFDSLVQTATGFNHDEGVAAGVDGPKELPAQALDHGSGQLMAAAAMLARARQAREGGSWHVRVSLAQTGRWLFGPRPRPDGLAAPDPTLDDVQTGSRTSDSAFGRLRAVRHAASSRETPAHFARPAADSAAHEPRWEDA